MTRDEVIAKTHEALLRGDITEEQLLAELYADIQEVKLFTQEFRTVLMMMQGGKMSGLLGKLLGGRGKDAVPEDQQESVPIPIREGFQQQAGA